MEVGRVLEDLEEGESIIKYMYKNEEWKNILSYPFEDHLPTDFFSDLNSENKLILEKILNSY